MKQTTNKIWQRTPISYYGGKQTMLPIYYLLFRNIRSIPKPFSVEELYFGQKKELKQR